MHEHKNHSKIRRWRSVTPFLPFACVGTLALLFLAMLYPASAESAQAAGTSISAYLPSIVQLTMQPNIGTSVEPTSDGTFKKMQTAVNVVVTSSNAFSVSLRGDSEMHGTNNNPSTIGPVATNSTEATFGNNTWGYSWAEGDTASAVYNPVPGVDTTLVNNQKTVDNQANKTYTLGFGAKVDNTLQADTYTGMVTVSVVATPQTVVLNNYSVTYDANEGAGITPEVQTALKQESTWTFTAASGEGLTKDGYSFAGWSESNIATEAQYAPGATITLTETAPQIILYAVWTPAGGFNGLKTMQGMTPDMCKNAKYGETARLEDIRDGKKYWVTKLADGNCWMVQNLDFDIPADGLSITTGSKLNWNPNNPTNKENVKNNTNYNNTNSWDQGAYVYNNPTGWASCGINLSSITSCTSSGGVIDTFVKVDSGYTASDDSNFTEKNGSPVNVTDKIYDAHYLIGNYYSYNAATAGTGQSTTTDSISASNDICPAGSGGTNWELPTAGKVNESSGTSFYQMLNAQGITVASGNSVNTSIATTVNAKNPTGTGATSKTINVALTTDPLFFVRAGRIYNSALDNPGSEAGYWSRTPLNANSAFKLDIDASYVSPSHYSYYRYFGFSLRCLYHPAS